MKRNVLASVILIFAVAVAGCGGKAANGETAAKSGKSNDEGAEAKSPKSNDEGEAEAAGSDDKKSPKSNDEGKDGDDDDATEATP